MKPFLKLLFVVFCVCIGTYVSYYVNGNYMLGIDDANIYSVYMRNVAHGNGFVYNIGGEHVEGFTSLLWCLIGAFYFLFTPNAHLLLLISNMVLISYTLWRLVCFVDDYFEDKKIITPYSLFILLSLLVFPGFFDWTVFTLMETGLWCCLLTLCFLNLFRWERETTIRKKLNVQLLILLVLLILTRPESMIWGGFFMLYRISQLYQSFENKKKRTQLSSLFVLVFIGTLASLTLWRLLYFGYPLPNTYYAKVSQNIFYNIDEGQRYIWGIIRFSNPFVLVILVTFLLFVIFRFKTIFKTGNIYLPLSFSVLITILIPLYSGGDHFQLGRMFQPLYPLMFFAVMVFFLSLTEMKNFRAWKTYITVFVLAITFVVMPYRDRLRDAIAHKNGAITHEFMIAKFESYCALKASEFFKEAERYPSQGVMCAGATAFNYKGNTLDLLGLNNVAMAHANPVKREGLLKNHASFNKDVFYQQKPDMVWLSDFRFMTLSDTSDFYLLEEQPEYRETLPNKVFDGLVFDKKFQENYFPTLLFKEGSNECLFIYMHKDFLSIMAKPPYRYKIFPRSN